MKRLLLLALVAGCAAPLASVKPSGTVKAVSALTAPQCEARIGKLCDTTAGGYLDCCGPMICAGPESPYKHHCIQPPPPGTGDPALDEMMAHVDAPEEPQAPIPTPKGVQPASPPYRPSYLAANVLRKPGQHLQWCDHQTCTQVGRHALQEVVTDVYLPEAILYAETVPACAGILHYADGAMEVVLDRLGTNYMVKGIKTVNGAWFVNVFDRQYTFPFRSLIKIAQCSVTNGGAEDCAASPLLTDNLRQLLNLNVTNGRCVTGNPQTLAYMAQPNGAYSALRGGAGIISPKLLTPAMALDAEDMRLLHLTHLAHKYATLCKIGRGLNLTDDDKLMLAPYTDGTFTCPAPPLTSKFHQLYEARCQLPGKGGETCHHARRLMDFSGKIAPSWDATPDDRAVILLLEDVAHEQWMTQQMMIGLDPLAWRGIVGEDNNHRIAHAASARGKRDMKVKPYRPDCLESCPVITVQQLVDQNRGLLSRLAP